MRPKSSGYTEEQGIKIEERERVKHIVRHSDSQYDDIKSFLEVLDSLSFVVTIHY